MTYTLLAGYSNNCANGQRLHGEQCILSILLFPFIFIVYLVYDFIIK